MPLDPDHDLKTLFDDTARRPSPEQEDRWARHAATLPERRAPRRWAHRLWPAFLAVPALIALAMWMRPDRPSEAPRAGLPVPTAVDPDEHLDGMGLLVAMAESGDDPLPEDDALAPVTRDPLRVMDGTRDPMAPVELLMPPEPDHERAVTVAYADEMGAPSAAQLQRVKKNLLEQRVGLTAAEADEVVALFLRHDERRRAARKKLRGATQRLRRLLRDDSQDDAAYEAALGEVKAARSALLSLRQDQLDALDATLSARKRARLYFAMHKVQRRLAKKNRAGKK